MRLRLKNSNGCWIGNNNKKDHRWFDCTCKQQTVASQKQTKIACKASVINLRFVSLIPMMKKKHILRNECLISHVRWQFYAVFFGPPKKIHFTFHFHWIFSFRCTRLCSRRFSSLDFHENMEKEKSKSFSLCIFFFFFWSEKNEMWKSIWREVMSA